SPPAAAGARVSRSDQDKPSIPNGRGFHRTALAILEGAVMRQRFELIPTERLLLRRWREPDRAPSAPLNGDPQTLVYSPATLSRAESDAPAPPPPRPRFRSAPA